VIEELARTLEKIFRGQVSSIDWRCADTLTFLGERQDLLEITGTQGMGCGAGLKPRMSPTRGA
jgi:hypothetical protein